MICKICNKENPEGSKFCKYCGASLEETKKDNVVNLVKDKNSEPKPAIYNKKNNIVVYLSYLFLSLGIIFLIGASVYYTIGLVTALAENYSQPYFNIYGGLLFTSSIFFIAAVILQIIYAFICKISARNYHIFSFVIEGVGLFFLLISNFWSASTNSLFIPLYYFFFVFGFVALVTGLILSIAGYKNGNK